MRLRLSKAGYALALALLFIGSFTFAFFSTRHSEDNNNGQAASQSLNWPVLIQDKGAKNAYAAMKETVSELELGQQHVQAHKFGEALYDTQGLDGMGVCDSSIGFGCHHQFFLSAVADKGIGIIKTLDDKCIEHFGLAGQGCQHGIGHGAMEYFSHSINDALNLCEQLSWQKKLFGCQSGVFMEYNFPVFTNHDGSTKSTRQFDRSQPYGPCFSVAPRYEESCLMAQAESWVKGSNLEIPQMEKLCSDLKQGASRNICALSIGIALSSYHDFDAKTVSTACTVFTNQEYMELCHSGSYWAFYDNEPRYRQKAHEVCEFLTQAQVQSCINNGSLLKYVEAS